MLQFYFFDFQSIEMCTNKLKIFLFRPNHSAFEIWSDGPFRKFSLQNVNVKNSLHTVESIEFANSTASKVYLVQYNLHHMMLKPHLF